MEKRDMSLSEYISTLVSLYDVNKEESEDNIAQVEELKTLYGEKTTTFNDVEQAIRMMIGSVLQDIVIGEQVQGIFNQSVLELLLTKGIITEDDFTNVASIMENATQQLYKEI